MLKDIFEQALKHEIKYLDSSFIYSQYVLRERLLVLSGYCTDAKQTVYMHGTSIAQAKLQTLILKLVVKLKGRYRGFFKLTSKEEHMSWLQSTSFLGKVVPAALY